MICFPNAKINLGLNIGSEEKSHPDKLHRINSIFMPIKLRDALEVIECPNQDSKIQITYSGLVTHIENDLCVKAYNLLDKTFNLPKVKAHLHKRIPLGSGLGGGSSNAVHMIKILNQMFGLNIDNYNARSLCDQLGSDCAFFTYNKVAHVSFFGSNIRELGFPRLVDIDWMVPRREYPKYRLILVVPKNISHAEPTNKYNISTTDIFSVVRERRKRGELFVREAKRKGPNLSIPLPIIEHFKEEVFNDLEDIVFQLKPRLKDIKNELYKNGAIYASMTGSGSGIYGIFPQNKDLHIPPVSIYDDFPHYPINRNDFIWKEDFEYLGYPGDFKIDMEDCDLKDYYHQVGVKSEQCFWNDYKF